MRVLWRARKTGWAGRVAECGVWGVGDVDVAVGIRFEALCAARGGVFRVEGAGGEHFGEEGGPGWVEGGELGLEC